MDASVDHPGSTLLDGRLDAVRAAPAESGTVELIVRRPSEGDRELLDECELDTETGLVGDNWRQRGSRQTDDGSAHPLMQLTLMNTAAVQAVAGDRNRWPLAGDQFYVDFDISAANLPAGTKLTVGDAVIEITEQPHLGCAKFIQRFGRDAHRWVNSDIGRELRLRGVNTRVVTPGIVRRGDGIRKR